MEVISSNQRMASAVYPRHSFHGAHRHKALVMSPLLVPCSRTQAPTRRSAFLLALCAMLLALLPTFLQREIIQYSCELARSGSVAQILYVAASSGSLQRDLAATTCGPLQVQTQYKGFSSLVFIFRVSALHYCDADAATTGPTAERVRSYLHHLDNAHSDLYEPTGHRDENDACHAPR